MVTRKTAHFFLYMHVYFNTEILMSTQVCSWSPRTVWTHRPSVPSYSVSTVLITHRSRMTNPSVALMGFITTTSEFYLYKVLFITWSEHISVRKGVFIWRKYHWFHVVLVESDYKRYSSVSYVYSVSKVYFSSKIDSNKHISH